MNQTHSAGTDVHHGRTTKDEAIVSAIRAQSAPFKGMMTGPAARAAGVEATAHIWEGMPHVFTSSIGTLDAADQALSLMAAFVADKLLASAH